MAPRQGTCQESSSVRQKRTAVIGRTPSPSAIIRFPRSKSILGGPKRKRRRKQLAEKSVRDHCWLRGLLSGNDAAINAKGEKAVAARRAAIGWRSQQTKDPGERAHSVFARDALQIQVAARPAVHVPHVAERRRPGVKARVAHLATPGTHPCNAYDVILEAAPPGTAWAVTLADRTEQGPSPLSDSRPSIRISLPARKALRLLVPQGTINREVPDGGLHCRTRARRH
jgi:hypothetical protein